VSRLILLLVGAAWAGVLLPPLLRSRMDSRPGSSVTSFRRQLTSLQRSTPGGMAPMRQMARPLAGTPRSGMQQRPGAPRTHAAGNGQQRRGSVATMQRPDLRSPYATAQRRPAARTHASAAPVAVRSDVRQRRQNILMMLLLATACTGFMAAVSAAVAVKYAFALSACMLVGYVYLLSQSRKVAGDRGARDYWQQAA
jgi:hypothetical protein